VFISKVWFCIVTYKHKDVKPFLSHKVYRTALIYVSVALRQTRVYTSRPHIRD